MTRIRRVTANLAVRGLAAAIAAVAAAAVTTVPANAKVFDKEHFHDSSVSDPYDCDGSHIKIRVTLFGVFGQYSIEEGTLSCTWRARFCGLDRQGS